MKHPLQEMMDKRRQGIRCGIPSYCSANELVIEIALRRAKERNIPVLIEATANQVNQFGGYTGMKPADFYQMVLKMAKDIDLPENMMILAGDHLGPLTWQKLHEAEDILMEDAACIPVAYYNDFWLQSPALKGTWHSPYGYWYLQYGYIEG